MSDYAVLLNVSIAMGSMLASGRIPLLFAAMATLAVFSRLFVFASDHPVAPSEYVHAAILGASFFATAILGFALSRQLRVLEGVSLERKEKLESIQRINALILQRMRSAVLVLDGAGKIEFANFSARQCFAIQNEENHLSVEEVSKDLAAIFLNGERKKSLFQGLNVGNIREPIILYK